MNPFSGLEKTLILTVLALGALLSFAVYERYQGAKGCKSEDTKAVVVQEAHDTKADNDALNQLKAENADLRDQLGRKPLHILVRQPASCPPLNPVAGGSPPPAAPAGPDTGVRDRARPEPAVDIGPGVQLIAEVGERVASIARACQLKAAETSADR